LTSGGNGIPGEFDYILLLFALFVIPRILQRFRLPTAVTSVGLGAAAGLGLALFTQDPTVRLLATFGIVSLFLFAGLEVDFAELRRETRVLVQHIVVGVAALFAVALAIRLIGGLDWRPSVLVSLALLTPSTGFILDALAALGVTESERFWIKSKAVATELVALAALFVTLQSETIAGLGLSSLILLLLVLLLPIAFRAFAALVVPYAPKSEFAFLLMIAVLAAVVTRRLGVYYLVGAFIVGIIAQRFRLRLPAIASEQMLHAVEVFASFFVPFYFFDVGLHLHREDFAGEGLIIGAAFLGIMIPLRIGLVAVHRRVALGESWRHATRIGVSMLPTLVFTLVLAEILADRFDISRSLYGGLVIYALGTTLIPGFALRVPAPEMDVWHEDGSSPVGAGGGGERAALEPAREG